MSPSTMDLPVILIDSSVVVDQPEGLSLSEKRAAAGRKGGLATFAKYGSEGMAQRGREGFAALCEKRYGGCRKATIAALAAQGKMRFFGAEGTRREFTLY